MDLSFQTYVKILIKGQQLVRLIPFVSAVRIFMTDTLSFVCGDGLAEREEDEDASTLAGSSVATKASIFRQIRQAIFAKKIKTCYRERKRQFFLASFV